MRPTRMWFALARLYGSADIPVLGLYEFDRVGRLCLIGGQRVIK